ncbi:hypothetical protein [Streptomyces sp. NPDC050600]|uniref:hypothetical protein n=1 Tax=unclassified Streptomyces TaxID=2593676 RepID=UPI00341406B7
MSTPKSSPSRRATLLAFAGVAAGGALPLAAAVPAAAEPVPSADPPLVPSPLNGGPAPAPGARLPMLIDPTDPWHFTPHPAGALTTRAIAGGLEVSDTKGVLATLTTGASTVTVRGPKRWFTEEKRTVTDAFDRSLLTGTTGWGVSPDGGSWSPNSKDDANVGDYKVEAGRGVITLNATGSSRHSVLSDKGLGDVRARARFSFDKKPTGAPLSLALTFSLSALSTHYRARLIVTPAGDVQLVLEKALDDAVTVLAAAVTVGTGFVAFDHWWVQVEKAGDVLRARAWKNGDPTPDWRFSLRDPSPDTALGAGTVGVRAYAATGAATGVEARVYDFLVEEASWVDPPVIAHDTWVRVLPEPFDGSWTPAVEQRVRAWAGDLSPDALSYAAMFLPYAPDVTDPARQGARVLGKARYSDPDAVTGERTVGADFQEYLGISWTFPGLPARAPEAPFLGCLDCSGFVRMVYGFHMGLPLLHEKAAPDHRGLPRTSTAQAKDGPGVKIADGGTAAPALDGLRIGDTVFFDADTDPESGGHIGIYAGVDQHGFRRFFSSRKTPNGPTLADVGGRSVLNGTAGETYTDKLRVIRRF